jgi:hypothetical protein
VLPTTSNLQEEFKRTETEHMNDTTMSAHKSANRSLAYAGGMYATPTDVSKVERFPGICSRRETQDWNASANLEIGTLDKLPHDEPASSDAATGDASRVANEGLSAAEEGLTMGSHVELVQDTGKPVGVTQPGCDRVENGDDQARSSAGGSGTMLSTTGESAVAVLVTARQGAANDTVDKPAMTFVNC